MGVELAGSAVYFGKLVEKPTMGDATRSIEREDVRRANRLMVLASALSLVVLGGARIALVAAAGAMAW